MLDILLYGASLLLEFAALVVLRVREPALKRPFRIPGGVWMCILLSAGPLALLIFSLVRSEAERIAGMNSLLFGAILATLGVGCYLLATTFSRREQMQR